MYYKAVGILDIVIIFAIIAGAILGFRSGIFVQLSSLIGIGFSIFFYTKFYTIISNYIKPWVDNERMLPYISTAILFIGSSIFSMIIGQILKMLIRKTPFGIFDRILGAIIGAAKWFFFTGLIVWMIGIANKKIRTKFIEKSYSQKILHAIMPNIFKKMTEFPGGEKLQKMNKKEFVTPKKKINPKLDF